MATNKNNAEEKKIFMNISMMTAYLNDPENNMSPSTFIHRFGDELNVSGLMMHDVFVEPTPRSWI